MESVFIIGGTTYDHIVYLPQFLNPVPQTVHQAKFNEATGSTGSGKALCLKKLGVNSTLYSVLGNDVFGQHIIRHLHDEGIDFFYDIDPAGTERHVNMMNAEGERISIFVTQSSEFPNININLIRQHLQKADHIVINIIAYCKQIVPELKEIGKPIWTDLHDYTDSNPYHEPFIKVADYLFLSSDNLTDYRHTMQNLMARGKELVVCTHGKKGATALTKNGAWFEVEALKNVNIVDSNGAGDNFFSGFLFAWLQAKPIQECLQFAAVCGASSVMSSQLVNPSLSVQWAEAMRKEHFNL